MNTALVNTAAGVIHAAMEQGTQTAAGLALALESAQLLQSPESAAELAQLREQAASLRQEIYDIRLRRDDARAGREDAEREADRLRARVAELEGAIDEALADHQLFDDSAHCQHDGEPWPCPTVVTLRPEAPNVPGPGALPRRDAVVTALAPLAGQREDPHDSPLHHTYAKGRDLPQMPRG